MYKTTFNISWQCYNNTVYIIDETSQYLYSFSGVGKIFWDAVLSNLSYPSICKKVLENYTNSTPEEIKNDFCDFVKHGNGCNKKSKNEVHPLQ